MTQESETKDDRALTSALEVEAQSIIRRDLELAETPLPTRGNPPKRLSAEEARRQSRRMYADSSVPRVRPERRIGGSSHSRAYLKQELCLYSDRAQTFFERNYESVNMALITCTLVTEAMGGQELADKISTFIEKRFHALETEMLTAVKELERGATEGGIPKEKQIPVFDHKRYYNLALHTPQSSQFMTVIEVFDRIVARAEGCWINRLINARTRRELVINWQRRLLNFILEIYKIRDQARQEARKTGFGQRAASIEEKVRREHADEKIEGTDIKTTEADNTPEAGLKPAEEAPAPKAAGVTPVANEKEVPAEASAATEVAETAEPPEASAQEAEEKPKTEPAAQPA